MNYISKSSSPPPPFSNFLFYHFPFSFGTWKPQASSRRKRGVSTHLSHPITLNVLFRANGLHTPHGWDCVRWRKLTKLRKWKKRICGTPWQPTGSDSLDNLFLELGFSTFFTSSRTFACVVEDFLFRKYLSCELFRDLSMVVIDDRTYWCLLLWKSNSSKLKLLTWQNFCATCNTSSIWILQIKKKLDKYQKDCTINWGESRLRWIGNSNHFYEILHRFVEKGNHS